MLLHFIFFIFREFDLDDHPCLDFLGIWIGLRAMSGVDKTAKAQVKLISYDMIMIGVLVVPVLSFAVMSLLLVFKA